MLCKFYEERKYVGAQRRWKKYETIMTKLLTKEKNWMKDKGIDENKNEDKDEVENGGKMNMRTNMETNTRKNKIILQGTAALSLSIILCYMTILSQLFFSISKCSK